MPKTQEELLSTAPPSALANEFEILMFPSELAKLPRTHIPPAAWRQNLVSRRQLKLHWATQCWKNKTDTFHSEQFCNHGQDNNTCSWIAKCDKTYLQDSLGLKSDAMKIHQHRTPAHAQRDCWPSCVIRCSNKNIAQETITCQPLLLEFYASTLPIVIKLRKHKLFTLSQLQNTNNLNILKH